MSAYRYAAGQDVLEEGPRPEVLVLLSGGVDSAACLHFFLDLGRTVCTFFVSYGQRAAALEMRAASAVADHYGVSIIRPSWTETRLKDAGLISGRNAFLITAAMMERPPSVSVIAAGIHAGTDYADCSKEFIAGMQAVLDFYSEGVQLAMPFLGWTKADMFEYCHIKNVPLHLTYSCERGLDPPCGRCLSCMDREAFDVSA